MTTKVFLSLSHADKKLVSDVKRRLPVGLAFFYEMSFENGESLITAMERSVSDAAVFVLFASDSSIASPWVNFEIDLARIQQIIKPNHRILVFPTNPSFKISTLPKWLQDYWIPSSNWTAADIARYITTVILEPDIGISASTIRVVGRGKALDKLEQLTGDHLLRNRKSPNVYVLGGFSGIGRRTFTSYYKRHALSAEVNLVYGPSIVLSPQADIQDVYRELRTAITDDIDVKAFGEDLAGFQEADLRAQIEEIKRLLAHFTSLGQAVTLVSTNGFFEDRGAPKNWTAPLLSSISGDTRIFVVTNRLFPDDWVSGTNNSVQMRIDELSDKDIRTLMIFTADRLRVKNFAISDELVRAIGGHPDVANAAVRLAALKGTHILERDPRQLFNIQQTILGENIQDGSLNEAEKRILNVLSWVPLLSGAILEKIICGDGKVSSEKFVAAVEALLLSCLITASGYTFSISPSIRQLFRRWHVTPPDLLKAFAEILSDEWKKAEKDGHFQTDLFDAFVYMHVLEGKSLPAELRSLLSPGTLFDVVRETYARGKDADDPEELERVASWADIAEKMPMSEATREEILSTVCRARIRLGQHEAADKILDLMGQRGNRSVLFLRGHSLRKQERYSLAIPILEDAIREKKYQRSAAHELALAYKKSGEINKLRTLLSQRGDLVKDSAMFADFQIGMDLARGDLAAAELGIENLSRMPDDDGKSDIRRAQLLIRRQQYKPAKQLLTKLLTEHTKSRFHIRSLRATAAAKDHDFELSRRDIDYVKGISGRQTAAMRLEVGLLTEQGNLAGAEQLLEKIRFKGSEDQLLQARIYELKADLVETGFVERQALRAKAAEIRVQHNLAFELDYED